jgi:hypothetical protein
MESAGWPSEVGTRACNQCKRHGRYALHTYEGSGFQCVQVGATTKLKRRLATFKAFRKRYMMWLRKLAKELNQSKSKKTQHQGEIKKPIWKIIYPLWISNLFFI